VIRRRWWCDDHLEEWWNPGKETSQYQMALMVEGLI
jgi:hypothetical protein